ncbi:DUF167 family protein [Pseudorhodoplanes sp.]|uniref:DUF167 family protein n=1 Tax=Pseudorhodoplanes sp. TaxID=1934341 RepID=UPI002D18D2AD|nr:DUF167 family protein [Pseudorhodoplanes sp.]HWV44217.1 DUF167 family protein [Pseudorhodoplanes sp.]
MQRPFIVTQQGLSITVRLTPKGGRDALDGIEMLSDGRPVLKARVRAAPTEGEANAALISLLAKTLDVPRRRVTLAAGDTSRIKRIEIEGDGAVLAARLQNILAG